ncbi:hypothetical protein TURU_040359 [Turdus rufiventris]|nr:hypothetical protein TURU_040359 [Turdus rufiventris]
MILNDWLHVKKKSQNLNKTLNAVNPILDPAQEFSAICTDNKELVSSSDILALLDLFSLPTGSHPSEREFFPLMCKVPFSLSVFVGSRVRLDPPPWVFLKEKLFAELCKVSLYTVLYSGERVEALELSGTGDIQIPVATPTLHYTFIILPNQK